MLRQAVFCVLLCIAHAFAPSGNRAMTGARRPRVEAPATVSYGKMAKFGVFSPAIYGARVVLGDKNLEKIRGKGIALHSQAISEFCYFVGAPGKMRGGLIKKAKTNGDMLGFLV